MHFLFFLLISLKEISGVSLRSNFAPTHIYHTPSEIHQSPCQIPEQFRTCSLKTTKKDSIWTGIKAKTPTSEKFISLQPTPKGSFDHARRVCETCDLEVAEIWNEDDLGQFLDSVEENKDVSYWIGAFLNKKQTQKFRWTYQDGKTFLGFKEGITETEEEEEEKEEEKEEEEESNKDNSFKRSCLTLSKNGNFSTWNVVSCDSKHQVICQYKKKYDCYTSSTKGIIYPIKDGYYFSSKGQPWSLASHSCQTNPQVQLSLLFFQLQNHKVLTSILSTHLKGHHHDPKKTEIWTAAKFQGGRFFWMLNDQKVEIKEWTNFPWGVPPKPEGKEQCVYAKFEGKALKLYAGSCDQERFFVCKSVELDGPQISYCEKDALIEKKASDCKWNWVFDMKPACLCFKGVHGLTSHSSCNTRLLIGPRCIKFSNDKKSILHWKPIQDVDPDGPFLLIQNRNRRGNKFIQWISLKPGSKRQIFGDANIYFSKGINVTASNGRYCFNQLDPSEKTLEFQEIRIRNESSWLSFNDKGTMRCKGSANLKITKHSKSAGKDECTLKCTKKGIEPSKEKVEINSKSKKSAQINDKDSGDLNTEILKHAMDSMFSSNQTEKVVQDKRFQLLEKLFEITKNICACMVPPIFFDNALELFKIAYMTESYEHVEEDFQKTEVDKISKMLANCQASSGKKAVVCEKNECSGMAVKTTKLSTDASIKSTPVDDTGYNLEPHHHLMEIVWHVIEIWNVGCIREFKESYLLYHDMEQVMEKLLDGQIRKIWHNPSVPQNYYKHLLGASESTHISNLENCVKAVYESNPKVTKLSRPKSAPLKLLGKQIRNRKMNVEFLHKQISKTIFCSKDQFCLD